MARMSTMLLSGFALLLFLASPLLSGSALAAQTTSARDGTGISPLLAPSAKGAAPLTGTPTELCGSPSGYGAGVYPAKGGAYLLDWGTGNVYFCSNGQATLLITSPEQAEGFYGLAGVTVGGKLDLVIGSWELQGLYICKDVTPSSGGTCGSFITLPSSFCSSEPAGECNIDGIFVDSKLNLYYADVNNEQDVTCTAKSGYQSCTVLYTFSGYEPLGITVDAKGNVWTTDNSETGNVWKNGNVFTSVGDSLEAIFACPAGTSSVCGKDTLVVGDDGYYSGTAKIIAVNTKTGDLKDLYVFSTSYEIIGGDVNAKNSLQFSLWYPGGAYQLKTKI